MPPSSCSSSWLRCRACSTWLCCWGGGCPAEQPGRGGRPLSTLGYTLVPLGLTAWIAFSLSFVFTNFSYVWPALSDPLGWGWDLFGTVKAAWTPYLGGVLPVLQAGVLVGGFIWSGLTARRLAGRPFRSPGRRTWRCRSFSSAWGLPWAC